MMLGRNLRALGVSCLLLQMNIFQTLHPIIVSFELGMWTGHIPDVPKKVPTFDGTQRKCL